MNITKRGIILIILILFFSSVVYADFLSVNLSSEKFSKNNPFSGTFEFNFSDSKPIDTKFLFHSGSSIYNISLNELFLINNMLNDRNLILEEATYKNLTNNKDSEIITAFTARSSKINAGLDLNGRNREPNNVYIHNVSFSIEPSGSPLPDEISIFIGGNKVFRHKGTPIGWAPLDKNYLGDFNPDGSQNIVGDSTFCQAVNVSDSGEYNITVKAKQIGGFGTVGLNATMIKDNPLFGVPDCNNPETPCCTLLGINNISYNNANCIIQKQIPEKRKEYLCIYPTNVPDISARYFSIRTESSELVSGFVNSYPAESNFYIYGDYRTYDRTLTRKSTVYIPIEYINSYIHGETGCINNCLLIPLNISVGSPGNIKLSELNIHYTTAGGDFSEDKFRKIVFVDKSARYNGTIKTELENFYDVLTPRNTGDYEFYVEFDSQESNHVDFETLNGPHAFIRYAAGEMNVHQDIEFNAGSSTASSGQNLTSYAWYFGDGKNATTQYAVHNYNNSGNYTVRLKVSDSSGLYDYNALNIQIFSGSSENIAIKINKTYESISNFRRTLEDSPLKVKDTANLLGLNQILNRFENNLTILKNEYDFLALNSGLSNEQIDNNINFLRQKIDYISDSIPKTFKVNISSFSGKFTGLNQIPSCCEFTTELQKTKLLVAQNPTNINSEAIAVSVGYNNRGENFIIIKKDIIGTGAKIYEFLPFGISIDSEDVIAGDNYNNPAPNIYTFNPTTQLIYKIHSDDLTKALQIRTAILPADLQSIELESRPEIEFESVCGNKLCENDESSDTCPKDCKERSGSLWIISIIAILLIAAIIYFGLFFKGGIFRNLQKDKIKNKNHLFKNEKDRAALKNFVKVSFSKGLDENKIRLALKSKGWKDHQIDSIIQEINPKKKN